MPKSGTALTPRPDVRSVAPIGPSARFTMANTPLPLDIGFYDAAGALINRLRMEPCPQGTDATCPTYAPERPFRYALEVPAGAGTAGAIGSCAA